MSLRLARRVQTTLGCQTDFLIVLHKESESRLRLATHSDMNLALGRVFALDNHLCARLIIRKADQLINCITLVIGCVEFKSLSNLCI